MVVGREDSGEVDTYVNEQETDVEEGGTTLEDERSRKVAGMKEIGRYKGDNFHSGVEENDDDHDEDVDVYAGG